jgi:hypothetical protein
MGKDARQRAEAAFAKNDVPTAEPRVAASEYEAQQAAININMERLRAERVAREAQVPPQKKSPDAKRRRARLRAQSLSKRASDH